MRVVVLGTTGRTGSFVADLALEPGKVEGRDALQTL